MSHTYADLLALADEAEIILDQPAGQSTADGQPTATTGAEVIEADDDPHRLARINLERYASHHAGRTLRFWRDEWYTWKHNRYLKITERELRAKLSLAIKEEFNRLNLDRQESTTSDDGGPPTAQKVSISMVSNVLQATSGMTVISSDVELNTWLPTKERRPYISMSNGLLDIDAAIANQDDYLMPNTPQWWSMVSLPYPFDPTATCPRWDAFLEYNLEMDPERIKLVQEWAGYLLLNTTDEQKFMILEGEGKNGKGVFIAGITAMLGEGNVSNVSLENFGNRFQLTDTIGKLLNAAGDCGDIDKTAEGTLKSFTSGDRMYFDRKGIPGLNCVPTARLMVACNNRPRFSDRSDGIYRRMIAIPWQVAIPEGKRVKGMDKVSWWQKSGELPGIFRWALVGLARLRAQNGFTESEVCNRALDDYRAEMNPARSFLEEMCASKPACQVLCCDLYEHYLKWCNKNGHSRPLSERQFGKEIKRKFPAVTRERETTGLRQWYYQGVEQVDTF